MDVVTTEKSELHRRIEDLASEVHHLQTSKIDKEEKLKIQIHRNEELLEELERMQETLAVIKEEKELTIVLKQEKEREIDYNSR